MYTITTLAGYSLGLILLLTGNIISLFQIPDLSIWNVAGLGLIMTTPLVYLFGGDWHNRCLSEVRQKSPKSMLVFAVTLIGAGVLYLAGFTLVYGPFFNTHYVGGYLGYAGFLACMLGYQAYALYRLEGNKPWSEWREVWAEIQEEKAAKN